MKRTIAEWSEIEKGNKFDYSRFGWHVDGGERIICDCNSSKNEFKLSRFISEGEITKKQFEKVKKDKIFKKKILGKNIGTLSMDAPFGAKITYIIKT